MEGLENEPTTSGWAQHGTHLVWYGGYRMGHQNLAAPMSRGTPHRTIRVDDELWVAAKDKAEDRGDNLSNIIRKALAEYISEGTKDDQ